LGEAVPAAGAGYGGAELVVAALWALRGFNMVGSRALFASKRRLRQILPMLGKTKIKDL
jgi:hypothetical protein